MKGWPQLVVFGTLLDTEEPDSLATIMRLVFSDGLLCDYSGQFVWFAALIPKAKSFVMIGIGFSDASVIVKSDGG
jgi:hypothetical protein